MIKLKFTFSIILFFALSASNAQWQLTGNNNATNSSLLGTTNSINLNLGTRNLTRMVIDSNGRVGIGMGAPPNILSVRGSGSTPSSAWVNSGNPLFTGFGEQTVGNADYILSMASSLLNARPVFIGRRARGTLAAPAIVRNNDQLMSFLSSGFDGSGFQNAAAIDFYADSITGTGSVPTRISFVTGSNAANRTERLIIGNSGNITMNTNQFFLQRSTGNIGLGTISPAARLDIIGGVKITDGTQSAGKVLTSDANGLASWQNIPVQTESDPKVGNLSANQIPKWSGTTLADGTITDNGNIGIGTTTPAAKLEVAGGDAIINGLTVGRGNGGQITNTVVGPAALQTNTTGSGNTAIGRSALGNNTTGSSNTATGMDALYFNTTGSLNAAHGLRALYSNTTGTFNTANGQTALYSNTTGSFNTAMGQSSLYSNTTGSNNTANGMQALYSNTIGTGNTATGYSALNSNTTGGGNTGNGFNTLNSNTTGSFNTANGIQTLYSNTTGSHNTANGFNSLFYNTTGHANVAVGVSALFYNTTRSNLVAIGDSALFNNGTGAVGNNEATANTALGSKTLYSNTTGGGNTAAGTLALYSNTTGVANTAHGYLALYSNNTGGANTANGTSSLYLNTSGYRNAAFGGNALYSNTSGYQNVANGFNALFSNTTGYDNTVNGMAALGYNTTGYQNTAYGASALYTNTTGNLLTAIGRFADVTISNLTNATAIGANATVDASNKVRIGNTSVTSIGGQVAWTNFSDGRIKQNIKENVPGLEFIKLLKPVTYNYNLSKEYELLGRTDSSQYDGKNDIEKINFTGFIAQDVEDAAKKINYDFSGVDKSGKIMGLRYSEFVVPLVKAVQELNDKTTEVQQLKEQMQKQHSQLQDQQKQIDELKAALLQLASQKTPCTTSK